MGLMKVLLWLFLLIVMFTTVSIFIGTLHIAAAIFNALFSPVLWITVIVLLLIRALLFKKGGG